MLIEKSKITDFIPQKPPFVMIDELLQADDNGFVSNFEVSNENILLKGEKLSSSALIENVAQTCAAGFGFLHHQKGEEKGQIGFIGSVNDLTVHGDASKGGKLETSVKILALFGEIYLIEGIVSNENGQKLLQCKMKIVLTDKAI